MSFQSRGKTKRLKKQQNEWTKGQHLIVRVLQREEEGEERERERESYFADRVYDAVLFDP